MVKSILGSGLIAVDHIFLAENPKSTKKLEYLGSAGGGTIPNTLCLLSLLGYKTHIFGVTGNDDIGERIVKEEFRLFSVNSGYLKSRGNKKDLRFTRQFSHLIFPDGTHRFKKNCLKCGSKFSREYQLSELDVVKNLKKLAEETDLLLLDRANKAAFSLTQIAKKYRRKVAYDLSFSSYGAYLEKTRNILKSCDLVKVNHGAFQKIMGSTDNMAIMRFREDYPNVDYLLVTNGENGVYGYAKIDNEKSLFRRNAIRCEHVRDSSGAGDIFFGMAASELLLKEPPENLTDFEQKIDLGQSLASLNCTMYGARALQRTYLNQKASPKEILDSANLIRESGKTTNSFSAIIGLPKPISEPYRLARIDGCKVCGSILYDKKRKKGQKSRLALSKVDTSLTSAPWTMRSSFDAGKTYRNIPELNSRYALFVGSGGSFTASAFVEAVYLQSLGRLAKAITPFEFEGLNKIDDDTTVWFISHGGGNTDILGAALSAEKNNHSKCIAFTGNKNSKLADMARKNGWKTIFIQSQERNFVSIIGLLSQVSALCGLMASDDDIRDLDGFFSDKSLRMDFGSSMRTMRSIAYEMARSFDDIASMHVVGFARGWGWPALIDLDSKIVEGGICTIEISELKNFTHGRYMNLFGRRNRRVLLIKTTRDAELVDYLYRKFKRYVPTFVIETEKKGIVGAVDLLVKSLFLAWYLGQIAKKNILKPMFPAEARGLYSWEPSYRKDQWKDQSGTKRKGKFRYPSISEV